MDRSAVIASIKKKFGGKIKRFQEKSSKRVYIDLDRKDIVEFASYVFKDLEARFNTATAVDHPENIEIMYHFNVDRLGLIITLRIYAPKDDCAVESLVPVANAVGWIEREMHELFGVEFKGHPDMKPLLLPDDWPKDKYPMRKEFSLNSQKESSR